MKLFYQKFLNKSNKHSIIILHGLLGSSNNWINFSKLLFNEGYNIYIPDLRNHGRSPWSKNNTYSSMVKDLKLFSESINVSRFFLIGHSLGGKISMLFSNYFPKLLKKLIIIDIAPKNYQISLSNSLRIIKIALELKICKFKNISQIENKLKFYISNQSIRKFLLTNLKWNKKKEKYTWKPNLNILYKNYNSILKNPLKNNFNYKGRTIFIKSKTSGFILDEDKKNIKYYFPNSKILTICLGHNPHIESKKDFLRILKNFLC
jgi:esterase